MRLEARDFSHVRFTVSSRRDGAEGTKWLLVCKQSRKQPVVILEADAFFEILKKAGMEADE